jgi:uncharacterized protein (DUF488 family)
MSDALAVYTIGHGNQTAAQFGELLLQHRIRLLIDVRSAPYSKYVPHFNKTALEKWLPEQGIDYRYAGQVLGGRPTQPEMYRMAAEITEDTERGDFLKLVDYEAVMQQDWYQKGISRLLQLVQETEGNVTMMCSEQNPLDCHRHLLIARSLLDPAVRIVEASIIVLHILKDGMLQIVTSETFTGTPRQLSLF